MKIDDLKKKIIELCPERASSILLFQQEYEQFITIAKGSSGAHQSWPGGYVDHILQCINQAEAIYAALQQLYPLPFSLSSAVCVLYFHDLEKIFKYSSGHGIPEEMIYNKRLWYEKELPDRFGIFFSPEELNALRYAHGEGRDYKKGERVMSPLAAFVHAIDIMSARIFHNVS
jgi:hypothetical protein